MNLNTLLSVVYSHVVQLGFDPWNKNILKKNKRLRHTIGPGEETDQTWKMKELQTDYDSLKETCSQQGKCPLFYTHGSACTDICVLSIKLLLDFDTALFDATLPTTSSIIRGETEEEWAEALTKTGKLALAGNMYRYCGSMMYTSAALLLACKIALENKHKEVHGVPSRLE